jgi:hypothetical protein
MDFFIQEPRLKSLWTNSSSKWVESFCAFVITNTSFDSKKMTHEDETFLKAVFKSLRSIDVMAYKIGLASALIRKKVIGDRALQACESLGLIEFPKRLEVICESAFESCIRWKRIKIPSAHMVIKEAAFSHYYGLISAELCEELQVIGKSLFEARMQFIDHCERVVIGERDS